MKKTKPAPPPLPIDYSGFVALWGALFSFAAFLYFYRHGETLLYGDAVAHINIARRIFDCREPGLRQLGTVWLPFPHLVMAPFLLNDNFWVSGIGGSLPSMVAFVLGAVGLYRLVAARTAHWVGGVAAGIYLLNPNLLYMQSTAMGESIYLALMIWAVFYLDAFARGLRDPEQPLRPAKALTRCAMVLAAAILTRYDGWFFTFIIALAALFILVRNWSLQSDKQKRLLTRSAIHFTLLCTLTPALWMSYNYWLSRHPLDFATGPYSAKAIAARTTPQGAPPYPGKDHMATAATYFLKAAKANMAEGRWQFWLMVAAVLGSAIAAVVVRGGWLWLLLWTPLPFYALSIAYGSVPIFVPEWWPFSYYNVRYGMELIPVFCVSVAFLASLGKRAMLPGRWQIALPVVVLAIVVGGYYASWRATPICLREAQANGRNRMSEDAAVARYIQMMPPDTTILMQTGSYVGALQMAGRHLDSVVWEGLYYQWELALNQPAEKADYIIAFGNDEVAQAVKAHPQGLESIVVLRVGDQAPATIYRSTARNARPL
ncbi:hypothetical protein Acid345_2624 [Candidatus Koribacter versatilis Ellin345]|uniref:Glycosyltransferase RgtA/B/C/D-like domain-containing protein n=1 Tax=Koribacter versatilis (strain Ellin345) TaxID=204669 RepID=Q1INC5_KORVE|nr:hypothetical protein [Candidatus Koribacter versatilis]ABF41625.1 hypothetical protein Acid345_2624 [Candidatus Koribacter versatilis Ellin345]